MPWNRTTTNKYLSNKTTGKLTEHVKKKKKISNMTTGNLTEDFQEFTQGVHVHVYTPVMVTRYMTVHLINLLSM